MRDPGNEVAIWQDAFCESKLKITFTVSTAIHKPFPVVSEVPGGIQHNGGNPKMSRQKEKKMFVTKKVISRVFSEFTTHIALSCGTVTMLYKVFLALTSMGKKDPNACPLKLLL